MKKIFWAVAVRGGKSAGAIPHTTKTTKKAAEKAARDQGYGSYKVMTSRG
jgi:hypothetical protein